MLYSLDIETGCNVIGCSDSDCDHALVPHSARILCIGIWAPEMNGGLVFRDVPNGLSAVDQLREFLSQVPGYTLVGHNLKFDLKMLNHHGLAIPLDRWTADSLLAATTSLTKVTPDYMAWYRAERERLNKTLKGRKHRAAGEHTLKVLAPFFLGVPAFWETPGDYDNDTYVLLDCEYSYRLAAFFDEQLKAEGLTAFYQDKQLPWARMVLQSEIVGVTIDLTKLAAEKKNAEEKLAAVKTELDSQWAPAYRQYHKKQLDELRSSYDAKAIVQVNKPVKKPAPDRAEKLLGKYLERFENAAAKIPREMNLGSPSQLAWILRDYFGLDITDFEGDDSTAKAVIQMLAKRGRRDLETFLEYREWSKLATAFFPSYEQLNDRGIIRCNFNPNGARTGRMSCSLPNLQQVPGELHSLFIARPGYRMFSRDMTAIEAKLIAYYSEDPILVDIVNSGKDFHGVNAKIYCGLDCDANEVKALYKGARDLAKEIGYALFYGAGWRRIQNVGMKHGYDWSKKESQMKVELFRETYRGAFDFKKQIDEIAAHEPITNLFGRKCAYPDKEDIYMKAFNTLIQGSASDMVLESGRRANVAFTAAGLNANLLLYVHDEIVGECPTDQVAEADEILERCMTNYDLPTSMGNIRLASEGEVDTCWAK